MDNLSDVHCRPYLFTQPMQRQSRKLISSEHGTIVDEADINYPIRLKHILPSTLFTISLTDVSSYAMRQDRSIIDTQTYKEWVSIEEFYEETGYTSDTTIDAWKGEVINPDYEHE
jgi:hypothetical protein